jgi:hypothetical protein
VAKVTPFGRRVATFVAACIVVDLYGYAIYHAWRTHLIGPGLTLGLLSLVAALGVAGLALAPAWLQRARGGAPAPQPVEPRTPRPWWLRVVLALASVAAGAALAVGDSIFLATPGHPVGSEWAELIAINAVCVGLLILTIIRLRRPTQIGIAIGVILTIQTALQLVPGASLARLLSLRFVFAIIQAGVFYVPFGLWAGHLWRRIMAAIFTPPRR